MYSIFSIMERKELINRIIGIGNAFRGLSNKMELNIYIYIYIYIVTVEDMLVNICKVL